jgi:hypothetical protein
MPWTSGRLSVRVEATADKSASNVSADFDLRGDSSRGELRLSSPLGAVLAATRWSATEVVLDTGQGPTRYADLETLSRDALGEALPLRAFPDWLAGRPVARRAVGGAGRRLRAAGVGRVAGRLRGRPARSRARGVAEGHRARAAGEGRFVSVRAFFDLPAPAKLNLFLHVVGRRADGYHLLQSPFVLIDWADTIHVERLDDGRLERVDLGATLPVDDLCLRAARALQQAAGCTAGRASRSTSRCPGAPAWAAAVPTLPPCCWR